MIEWKCLISSGLFYSCYFEIKFLLNRNDKYHPYSLVPLFYQKCTLHTHNESMSSLIVSTLYNAGNHESENSARKSRATQMEVRSILYDGRVISREMGKGGKVREAKEWGCFPLWHKKGKECWCQNEKCWRDGRKVKDFQNDRSSGSFTEQAARPSAPRKCWGFEGNGCMSPDNYVFLDLWNW